MTAQQGDRPAIEETIAILEAAAVAAESSTLPSGHGPLNSGSRSEWYAHGRRDAAAAIRDLTKSVKFGRDL